MSRKNAFAMLAALNGSSSAASKAAKTLEKDLKQPWTLKKMSDVPDLTLTLKDLSLTTGIIIGEIKRLTRENPDAPLLELKKYTVPIYFERLTLINQLFGVISQASRAAYPDRSDLISNLRIFKSRVDLTLSTIESGSWPIYDLRKAVKMEQYIGNELKLEDHMLHNLAGYAIPANTSYTIYRAKNGRALKVVDKHIAVLARSRNGITRTTLMHEYVHATNYDNNLQRLGSDSSPLNDHWQRTLPIYDFVAEKWDNTKPNLGDVIGNADSWAALISYY